MRIVFAIVLTLFTGCSSMPENRAYCSLDRTEMQALVKFWNFSFGIKIADSDAVVACTDLTKL